MALEKTISGLRSVLGNTDTFSYNDVLFAGDGPELSNMFTEAEKIYLQMKRDAWKWEPDTSDMPFSDPGAPEFTG